MKVEARKILQDDIGNEMLMRLKVAQGVDA